MNENLAFTKYYGHPTGTLIYSLTGADAGHFFIDISTGQILMLPQDYEHAVDANGDNIYEVTIVATDIDGNIATANQSITVNDVNDAPIFLYPITNDALNAIEKR